MDTCREAARRCRRRRQEDMQKTKRENQQLKEAIQAILEETTEQDRPELRDKILDAARMAVLERVDRSSSVGSPAHHPGSGYRVEGYGYGHGDNQRQPTLVPDPFQYLAANPPPQDMLPFMGQGAYSLAGRITWAVIEKALGVYRELSLFEGAGEASLLVLIKPRVEFRKLSAFLPLTRSATDKRNTYLMALWEAHERQRQRQRRRYDGQNGLPVTSGTAVSTHWLLGLMERERVSGENNRLRLLLTPSTAERRLRTLVGEDVFGVIAKAASENEIGRVSVDGSNLVDGLLDHLADTFTCFGEGPRWDIQTFDHVLKTWLSSVSQEAVS